MGVQVYRYYYFLINHIDMKPLKFILIFAISMVMYYGCNEEAADLDKAKIDFRYLFKVNDEGIKLGETYIINGSTVAFDAVNLYMGGIIIRQENGNITDLDNQYVLGGVEKTMSNLTQALEISPITNIQFYLGVNPEDNAMSEIDYTQRNSDDPLGIHDPSMHWSWNTGYKFISIDGRVDTDSDGVVDSRISYHLGTNDFLKQLEINRTFPLQRGKNVIDISFNLDSFLENIDIPSNLETHTTTNPELAHKLYNNITQAVSF